MDYIYLESFFAFVRNTLRLLCHSIDSVEKSAMRTTAACSVYRRKLL